MFCMHCGQQLPDNAKFCFKCGKKTFSESDLNIKPAPVVEPVPATQTAPIGDGWVS